MTIRLKRLLKFLGIIPIVILLPVYLYLLYAVGAFFIYVRGNSEKDKQQTEIFICSNGFHSEIVVPAVDSLSGMNWLACFHNEGFDTLFPGCKFISFSWGDKAFFMESFDKPFLSPGTTLKAIFIPTPALMHVEYLDFIPQENNMSAKLYLSVDRYKKLCNYISASFEFKQDKRSFIYFHPGYGTDDFFYNAKGSYHLFQTCNDWTNDALKYAGLPHTLKAPFAEHIMFYMHMQHHLH
jgi:uncharacterized protein (TIGR02117 family)